MFDIEGKLFKIQVKSAWFDSSKNNYVVGCRRTKTNRRTMLRAKYKSFEFDFAVLVIEKLEVFYVMPFDVFNSYGSEIHLVETAKRQRKPKSWVFREAWELFLHRAASKEILR